MNLFSIKTNKTLNENLNSLGLFIRKSRTQRDISIEHLAEAAFLRPETIRKLEASKCLPVPDETFKRIESALGCKANVLMEKVDLHREYLVQFIELYKNQIIAMLDSLRIYQADEAERILTETCFKWNQKNSRKEITTMATTRKMAAVKPAVKTAPKRAASPAKTAPTKRSTATPRSTSTKRK